MNKFALNHIKHSICKLLLSLFFPFYFAKRIPFDNINRHKRIDCYRFINILKHHNDGMLVPGIHSLGLNFIISIVITKKDNNQICTLNPLVKSFANTLAYRNIIGFEKFGVIAPA
jgi:hypothetical protein